jgi:DNA-binding transcriptional regulator YiaG
MLNATRRPCSAAGRPIVPPDRRPQRIWREHASGANWRLGRRRAIVHAIAQEPVATKEGCLSTPRLTPRQIKAARALLGWSQAALAKATGLSIPTIKRIESKSDYLDGHGDIAARVLSGFETAGAEFIAENGGGVGVRLREGRKPEIIALENLNASNDE